LTEIPLTSSEERNEKDIEVGSVCSEWEMSILATRTRGVAVENRLGGPYPLQADFLEVRAPVDVVCPVCTKRKRGACSLWVYDE
jgi:hypothetical protein